MEGKCHCGGTLTHNAECEVCIRENRKRLAERRRQIESATPMSELWCINVLGPDTIIAQTDFATAVRRAHEWNTMFAKLREQRGNHPYDPICHCNVIPYTGDPKRHAEQLAEHGGAPEDIC